MGSLPRAHLERCIGAPPHEDLHVVVVDRMIGETEGALGAAVVAAEVRVIPPSHDPLAAAGRGAAPGRDVVQGAVQLVVPPRADGGAHGMRSWQQREEAAQTPHQAPRHPAGSAP